MLIGCATVCVRIFLPYVNFRFLFASLLLQSPIINLNCNHTFTESKAKKKKAKKYSNRLKSVGVCVLGSRCHGRPFQITYQNHIKRSQPIEIISKWTPIDTVQWSNKNLSSVFDGALFSFILSFYCSVVGDGVSLVCILCILLPFFLFFSFTFNVRASCNCT